MCPCVILPQSAVLAGDERAKANRWDSRLLFRCSFFLLPVFRSPKTVAGLPDVGLGVKVVMGEMGAARVKLKWSG